MTIQRSYPDGLHHPSRLDQCTREAGYYLQSLGDLPASMPSSDQNGPSAGPGRPNAFATLPKKRKNNQTKTRASRRDSRAKGNAAGEASAAVGEAGHGGLGSLVAYERIKDHSDGESVAMLTHEPQLCSNGASPLGSYTESTKASEDCFSLGGRISPFMEIRDEDCNSNTSEHLMQAQIASPPQMNIDNDSILNLVGNEKPEILKFGFDHPIFGDLDKTFDFPPEVDIDLATTVTKFPVDNWFTPGFPPASTAPITTEQVYSDSSQKHPTGLGPDFGPMMISDSNGNAATWVDIWSGISCGQSQRHCSPTQSGVGQRLADTLFDTFECGPNMSTTIPSPHMESSGKGGRKRLSSADAEGGGGESAQSMNSGRSPRETGGESLLACPFHKKDPQRYQDCGKYTLRRIKDVKQHIYRLHCKPELYCPRCFTNFKCSRERDDHIREEGCTKKEVPSFDGTISDDQRKGLKDCGGRGTGIQEQWMKVWEVLFPGTKPPRSPHIENDRETLLSCLRNYWHENAGKIIEVSLGGHDPESEGLDSSQIKEVIDSILNHFETDLPHWDRTRNNETATACQPPLDSESFLGDMLNYSWPPCEKSEIEATSPAAMSSPDSSLWCLDGGFQLEFLK